MRKYFVIVLLITIFISCNRNDKFVVEGEVLDAKGQTLYLEQNGLLKVELLDSVKLDESGSFKMKAARPEYPDFYRLRLGNKVIDFAIDSCETITIKASDNKYTTDYTIEGSQTNADILKLKKSLAAIQLKANKITPDLSTDQRNAIIAVIEAEIEQHKKMASALILKNPRSSAAYFAIYQKIGNAYLFSPYNVKDKPYCAAVATAYNAFMPEYVRTKNLYALVLDAINTQRKAERNASWRDFIDTAAKGYIDIALKDRSGVERKLSELEGKIVLIDFSAYEMENNVAYTFDMRELYDKYKSRGFEIYQISLDRSKLLWEEGAANVPWISVRDENGPETSYIASYNVQALPTMFLMNQKGEVILRAFDFKTIDNAISKLL